MMAAGLVHVSTPRRYQLYLSIHLSTYLYLATSTCLSLSTYPSISVYLPFSIYLSTHLFYLPTSIYLPLPDYLHLSISIHLYPSPSIYVSYLLLLGRLACFLRRRFCLGSLGANHARVCRWRVATRDVDWMFILSDGQLLSTYSLWPVCVQKVCLPSA